MVIVGFSFTKMLAEKKKPIQGKVNITNNVVIKNISESKMAIDKKKKALKFEFLYSSRYEPGIGLIELAGETIFLADSKNADEALKEWKKNKKVPNEIMHKVMSHILAKCNVQAVVLSKDLNVPPPIPMPKMK